MSSATRRWLSIDGLVTLVLAANWLWFLLLLSAAIPEMSPMVTDDPGAPEPANNNPWVFPLVFSLMAGSLSVTLACSVRRRGARMLALLGHGGCAAFGLVFIGIQVWRFAEPSLATNTGIATLLLWRFAEHLSLCLLAGLALLLLASIVALTRRRSEVPSLLEQVTAWHWHALDTFWLVLVALAWHWGVMESL